MRLTWSHPLGLSWVRRRRAPLFRRPAALCWRRCWRARSWTLRGRATCRRHGSCRRCSASSCAAYFCPLALLMRIVVTRRRRGAGHVTAGHSTTMTSPALCAASHVGTACTICKWRPAPRARSAAMCLVNQRTRMQGPVVGRRRPRAAEGRQRARPLHVAGPAVPVPRAARRPGVLCANPSGSSLRACLSSPCDGSLGTKGVLFWIYRKSATLLMARPLSKTWKRLACEAE